MFPPTKRRLTATQRITFIGGGCTTFIFALTVSAWYALPAIAPQFVMRNSPWVEPLFRASMHEYEGMHESDYTSAPSETDSMYLADRLINEDEFTSADWMPHVIAALSDPDVRMRRVGLTLLKDIYQADRGLFSAFSNELLTAVYPLLSDPDDYIFQTSFAILKHHDEVETAKRIFSVLPRAAVPIKFNHVGYSGCFYPGFESELTLLSQLDLITLTTPWLDSNDPKLVIPALYSLSFSRDPAAIKILDKQLGRWHDTIEINDLFVVDPAVTALSHMPKDRVIEIVRAALASSNIDRRRSAAELVTHLEEDPVPQSHASKWQLIRTYRDDPDETVRCKIAIAIARDIDLNSFLSDFMSVVHNGGKPALIALQQLHWTRYDKHRRPPWEVGGGTVSPDHWNEPGNPELEAAIVAHLAPHVTDPDVAIRRALANYLKWTWELETVDAMTVLAHDDDAEVREVAEYFLRECKGQRFTPATEPNP